MEAKLTPYQATQAIEATSVLVLAPHPDDEVFGCGGAIMRHLENGVPLRIIIVSDGAHGLEGEERRQYTLMRQQESIEAARILGYGRPVFWDFRDREVNYGESLILRILEAVGEADLIYAPSVLEMHPDHRAVGMAAVEAVRRLDRPVNLALYEVGIPLAPNLLLDITNLAERKMAAMQCFVSQNAQQRYDLDIAALNRYRTYTLPAQVTAAEAYILTSAEELANDPLKLYQSEHKRQRQLGLALDGNDVPLVSVIIRSMDRHSLAEALDSVALQTYPHIEVVVVNAKGGTHSRVAEYCGAFPLRLLDSDVPLARGQAANKGLAQARGQYLIFLDDDDLFYPQHIERLVRACLQEPKHSAAYAGVEVVDQENNRLLAYDQPWVYQRLLCANFLPIHAVLFSRQLVDQGCRIDEDLAMLEEWDFWLQIAQQTAFVHVPGISAAYRSEKGLSEHRRHYRQIVVNKWLAKLGFDAFEQAAFWAASQLDELNQRNIDLAKRLTICAKDMAERQNQLTETQSRLIEAQNQLADRNNRLNELQNRLEESESQLAASREALADRQQQLEDRATQLHDCRQHTQALLKSHSWRITAPLRRLTAYFRGQ